MSTRKATAAWTAPSHSAHPFSVYLEFVSRLPILPVYRSRIPATGHSYLFFRASEPLSIQRVKLPHMYRIPPSSPFPFRGARIRGSKCTQATPGRWRHDNCPEMWQASGNLNAVLEISGAGREPLAFSSDLLVPIGDVRCTP
jgi:hypothetical protein